MRALVTGANGFLGAWLTRKLLGKAEHIRCLVRKTSATEELTALPVELMYGDVVDRSSLLAASLDCDVVFHLSGIRRAPSRALFFRVNAEGTRNVCDAMIASKRRQRLVLCSSLAAAGPSTTGRPRREEDSLSPEEWYGESKAEAERIALSFADRLEVTRWGSIEMSEDDVEALAAAGTTRVVVSATSADPQAQREEISAFAERFKLR